MSSSSATPAPGPTMAVEANRQATTRNGRSAAPVVPPSPLAASWFATALAALIDACTEASAMALLTPPRESLARHRAPTAACARPASAPGGSSANAHARSGIECRPARTSAATTSSTASDPST
jgi:hypothetical protein